MAQYENFIDSPIEDYGEDWSEHNGAAVQAFLEEKLRAHESDMSDTRQLGLTFTPSEDGSKGTLSIADAKGVKLGVCDLPLGGGASSAEGIAVTRLRAEVSAPTIREGMECSLTFHYSSLYSGGLNAGEPTGLTADIEVEVVAASMATLLRTSFRAFPEGTKTIPIGPVLREGVNSVYVRATVTDPSTGAPRVTQAYTKVTVVSVSLACGFSLSAMAAAGGYAEGQAVPVPFTVYGAGSKVVRLYVDGTQTQTRDITREGATSGSFQITGLLPGLHSLQLVAEVSQDDVSVLSSAHYIDVYVRDPLEREPEAWVAVKTEREDGAIRPAASGAWRTPLCAVRQRGTLTFEAVAYDPARVSVPAELRQGDTVLESLTLGRSALTVSHRFTEEGPVTVALCAAGVERAVGVEVIPSGIDVNVAAEGMTYSLAEEFSLRTGQTMELPVAPLATDPRRDGLTVEVTFRVTDMVDPSATVMECLETSPDGSRKGILITGDGVAYLTGERVDYINEDGQSVTRDVRLASNFTTDTWYKAAFVFRPDTGEGHRQMELFLNGDRVAADIYGQTFTFAQEAPQRLLFASDGADVEVRSVRVWGRDLSDDELLENDIADTRDPDELEARYRDNDVLDAKGVEVDFAKVMARGGGTLRIIRKNLLDDIFATNDKKAYFLADVIFDSPFGPEHSFVLRNCYICIQGTSSTKYPAKNLRIFILLASGSVMMVNGRVVTEWPIRPGAIPVEVFCLKADSVDSSMSLNTGGAKLFHDVMLELGLLTPPQRAQLEAAGGNDLSAVTVRQAIDGYPVDVFVAATEADTPQYVGQYNLNNEKSKSGRLFGMEGVEGFTPECPLALETLNNTSPVCLFDVDSDEELETLFDDGAEVNYGIDVSGAPRSDGDCAWHANPKKGVTELGPQAKEAVRSLFAWLRSCKPAGADPSDLSTFRSPLFRSTAADHFDVDHLCVYYLMNDYRAGVDQLAKNMLMRTWDGRKWYATYYDGDTQAGKRNDGFLVYLYNISRSTWDAEMGKYAFEGHDSLLWNLLLANFEAELRAMAGRLRSVLTLERMLTMYNVTQSGHWPTRLFNKSGYLKYIRPAVMETYGRVWPYIYMLQGSNIAHRTHFLTNRCALLDARYGVSAAHDDNIDFYLARSASDVPDRLIITPTEEYVFGYGTNNSPDLYDTGLVSGGEETEIAIAGAYTINDPLRLYGASRIRVLDMRRACSHLKNGFDLGKCTALRELDLSVPSGSEPSTSWFLGVSGCRALRRLSLRGQTGARTSTGAATLDLSAQVRLEELDATGTAVTAAVFAPGAPLAKVQLPATLRSLTLDGHRTLTADGLRLAGGTALESLTVRGCPALDTLAMVRDAVAAGSLRRVELEGVAWTRCEPSVLTALAEMGASLTGTVSINGRLGFEAKLAMLRVWGNIDSPDNPLHVTYTRYGLTSVSILGDNYLPAPGDYTFSLFADPAEGNDMCRVEWSLESNPYAVVDPLTGTVTVRSTGTEEDEARYILTATLTLVDGETLTASISLGFYERSVKVGDYLFADGTISDIIIPGKTLVGKCFYIDPADPTLRLWASISAYKDIVGLGEAEQGTSRLPLKGIKLADDPDYDPYLVKALGTKDAYPINTNYNAYDFTQSSPKEDGSSYNSSSDEWRIFPTSSTNGELGWTEHNGSMVPYGYANTAKIIAHRNKILSDSGINLPIPAADTGRKEKAVLEELMAQVISDNGGTKAYKALYYPLVSYCYAHEPAVAADETLHPKLRAHRWFMPAGGEAFRLGMLARFRGFFSEFSHPDRFAVSTDILAASSQTVRGNLSALGNLAWSTNAFLRLPNSMLTYGSASVATIPVVLF